MSHWPTLLALDLLLLATVFLGFGWTPGREGWTRLGLGLSGAAAAFLLLSLVRRGLALGFWPLTTRFDFGLWFALAVLVLFALLLARGYPARLAVAFVPLATAVLAGAILLPKPHELELQPVGAILRSGWLPVHVLAAALGYGAGAGAGALGLGILLLERVERSQLADANQSAAQPMTRAMHRMAELAFVGLSLALWSGMIWAHQAWGEYWSWFPKETWALVTWLIFLTFLHARGLPGWRARLPWLVWLGLLAIAFTLYGVPWLVRRTAVFDPHIF